MRRLIKTFLAIVFVILPVITTFPAVQAAPAGITVSPTSGLITTEAGGTATFTVVLNSEPTASVTINISSSNISEMTVPASVTINTGNWNTPVTVTCTGVNDAIVDGNQPVTVILSSATSADPAYNGLDPADVSVINQDNDCSDLSVAISGSAGVPGGAETYTITITNNGPGANNDVQGTDVLPAGLTLVNASGTSGTVVASLLTNTVTFSGALAAGANVTLTINANINSGASGLLSNTFSATSSISDTNPANNFATHILDLDSPDLTVGKTHTGDFYQGQTGAAYTITVTNNGNLPTSGAVTVVDTLPASLTYIMSSGNGWACSIIGQTLTATRADALAVGASYPPITLTVIVAGNAPASITNTATVSGGGEVVAATANNSASDLTTIDQAGFTIAPVSLDVSEGGAAAAFAVKLNTPPTADVSIPISSSNTSEMTVSPASITFTNLNWNTPQTVTVTPVDDTVVDGNQTVTAVLSAATSADAIYNGLNPVDVTVTVHDNDNNSGIGEGEDSSLLPVKSTTGQASVYPSQGGTISLGGDVSLNIPAGALSGGSSLPIKIEKIDPPPALPAGFMIKGSAYRFTVNGQEHCQFNHPVTITFTFDPSQVAPDQTPSIYYYDDSTSRWVKLEGTIYGNTISVTIEHFTIYGVLVKGEASQAAEVKAAFTDISSSWAKEAIEKMASVGAVSGYPDGSFKPDASVTRAEFVTMLVKALKLENSATGNTFNDTANSWAKENIATAAGLGIVGGCPDGSFRPEDLITREQMAVIAVKAARLQEASGETSFSDNNQISSWARGSVLTAVNSKLLKGYPDNTFLPQGYATRAEAVSVILNLMDK